MTTMKYPYVNQEEGSLKVEFGPEMPGARRQPVRMVLDFGLSSEILGIEIINLVLKVGKRALESIDQAIPITGERVRYSYDEESDSFYLRLEPGNSLTQRSVDGWAICDEKGRINALSARWAESPSRG